MVIIDDDNIQVSNSIWLRKEGFSQILVHFIWINYRVLGTDNSSAHARGNGSWSKGLSFCLFTFGSHWLNLWSFSIHDPILFGTFVAVLFVGSRIPLFSFLFGKSEPIQLSLSIDWDWNLHLASCVISESNKLLFVKELIFGFGNHLIRVRTSNSLSIN